MFKASAATLPDEEHNHSPADSFEALTFTHCKYHFWHLCYLSFSPGILQIVIEQAHMNLKIS